MPRFSSLVRAPAFLFRAALWQSHYAIPLPNASAPSVRAVRPLFDWRYRLVPLFELEPAVRAVCADVAFDLSR